MNAAETTIRELDKQISKLFPFFKRAIGDRAVDGQRRALLKKMNQVLLSSEKNANKLDPIIDSTTVCRWITYRKSKIWTYEF